MIYNVSTSEGSVSMSGFEWGLPLLIRAPKTLRNLAVAIKPFSDPRRVLVSCSLDTGVREALHSLVYSGHRCRMCSQTASG